MNILLGLDDRVLHEAGRRRGLRCDECEVYFWPQGRAWNAPNDDAQRAERSDQNRGSECVRGEIGN